MSQFTADDVKKYCAISKISLHFKLTIKGEVTYSRVGVDFKDDSVNLPAPEDFQAIVEELKNELLKFVSTFDKEATAELCTPEEYHDNVDNDETEEDEDDE